MDSGPWLAKRASPTSKGVGNTAIDSRDDSLINMSGGKAMFLWARDASTINFSGGEILFDLSASGSSNVTVSGGYIDYVSSRTSGAMNITAGEIDRISAHDGGRVNLFGGRVESRIGVRDGILNVFGGTISEIDATVPIWEEVPTPDDFTRVNIFDVIAQPSESPYSLINIEGGWMNIYGGTFDIPVVTHGEAITHIRGGSYSEQFEVGDDALMHVYGYDLDWTDDRLTGTLTDGTPIDAPAIATNNGQYILHEIPEPGVIVLLLGAAVFLIRSCRGRHSAEHAHGKRGHGTRLVVVAGLLGTSDNRKPHRRRPRTRRHGRLRVRVNPHR